MSADGHVAWTWVFANYILGKDYMLTIEQQENLYHIKPLVSGALFMHNIFQLLDISPWGESMVHTPLLNNM